MHFFALTIRNHIMDLVEKIRESQTESRKMIIMIPAMPEKTLLNVCDAITGFFLKKADIYLTLKVAKVLTDTWSREGKESAAISGWLDDRGNLTYYRSNVLSEQGKFSLIILCGADRVTDAASLSDFHSCDPQMIWDIKMKGSFRKWIAPKLENAGISEYQTQDLLNFDRILIPLMKSGRGDILQISDWLSHLDLNNAGDVSQALKIMLGNFGFFEMPLFTSFPFNQKRKQIV